MRPASVAAVAWLAALGTAAAQAPSSPPPLSAYSRLPAIEEAALSTDGSRLAYVTTAGDKRVANVRPTNAAKPVQQLDVGSKSPRGLDWIGPDHLLILIQQTLGGTPGMINRQQVTQAISYDARQRRSVVLLKGVQDVLPAVNSLPQRMVGPNAPAVLVEGFNLSDFGSSFYRVNANLGVASKLDDGKIDSLDWLARPDGTLVAKSERAERGPWLLKVRRGGGWKELLRLPPGPDYPSLVGFGRDGASILVSDGPNGEPGLFELSPATAAWTRVTPAGRTLDNYFFDDAGDGRLLAVTLEGAEPELLAFDPTLERTWASVRKSFPGKRVELIDFADDRRKLVVRTSGPDDPGAYYFFDLDAKRAELIGEPYPELSGPQIAATREVAFAARDGVNGHGVLTLPRGREPRRLPLVVFAYSNPAPRQDLGFNWMAQALASRGYAVLALSGRDSAPGVTAPVAGSARKLLDDAEDAVRALGAQGLVDPERVCGLGRGLGGWTAVSGATARPSFRCAVSIDGVLDVRREVLRLREFEGGRDAARRAAFERALGVSGPSDPALTAMSLASPRAGSGPVLLLYASDNLDVSPAYSRGLEAALKKAGRPVQIAPYPGQDAYLLKGAQRERVLAETVRFLLANNPPG